MKYGSLFSGIGGFDLGFEQAGLESAWQVEIDKDCQRVLRRHWPNVELFDDVKAIGKLSDVDVLCGGFPCQDLSVAGKRKGLAGERSGLWFEFLRIAECNQPRWVVIENVPGLLSSDEGRDFAAILRGLVNVGYRIAWRVTDAQYFGVAQRRRRVFIVGSLGDGSCAEILFESEGVSRNSPPRREAGAGIAPTVRGGTESGSNEIGNKVAATLDQRGRGPTDSVMMNLIWRAGDQANAEQFTLIAFAQNTRDEVRIQGDGKISGALSNQPGMKQQTYIAFDTTQVTSNSNYSSPKEGDPCHPLASGAHAPAIAFHENKSGQLSEADVLGLRSGASHSYQGVGGNFGVRRLTPRECERLQGFPDIESEVIIEVCLDPHVNHANAGNQNPKSLKPAKSVASAKSRRTAQSATTRSPQGDQNNSRPAPLSVLINCGENEVEISSQGILISYANTAGRQSGYRLPIGTESFVRLIAGISIAAEQITQTGREAFPANGQCSIHQENGKPLVRLSGGEITRLVNGAIADLTTQNEPTKSITLNHSQLSPLELRLVTSFCSAWVAIIGCIPERMLADCISLRLQLNTKFGWTAFDSEGKEISDSARYRMLGNAVAVPNAKWIGTCLRSHDPRLARYKG